MPETMSPSVVTRFAPSPTGFLHIGGARTALFNWLLARNTGGKMLLRIEDTDRERSSETAVTAILDGLTWMGLDWDGDPVSQFARADRHREVAEQLVAEGKAYYCYASQQELQEMRDRSKQDGRPAYDRRWRDRDPADAPEGVAPVVRIMSPLSGVTIVEDRVQGDVRFPNEDLDDFVILRSDKTPTYMHAVVVDDHDMGITHIVRGDDHLTNAARQTIIYKALGWTIPVMAHIPLIHGDDGAKLSKRHGALGVEAYREMGYLPEALRNYLVRLGWSHGDDEVMSTDDMIRWFAIEDVNKGASRFDFKKLEALNGHYMRAMDADALTETFIQTLPYLPNGMALLEKLDAGLRNSLRAAMPALKERAKTLVQLADGAAFLFDQRPLIVEEKASASLSTDARELLAGILPKFESVGDWNIAVLEAVVRAFAEEKELKLGKVAQPLRAALTGRNVSPGVFDVLAALGRDESLARIRDQTG